MPIERLKERRETRAPSHQSVPVARALDGLDKDLIPSVLGTGANVPVGPDVNWTGS